MELLQGRCRFNLVANDTDSMLEKILGDGEGQGSLACCKPWVCKESGMNE